MPLSLGYTKCSHLVSKTCHRDSEILPWVNFDKKPELQDCEKFCDEDEDCKFFFHFSASNSTICRRYKSCDKLRKPEHTGSTYSNGRKCPESKEGNDENFSKII